MNRSVGLKQSWRFIFNENVGALRDSKGFLRMYKILWLEGYTRLREYCYVRWEIRNVILLKASRDNDAVGPELRQLSSHIRITTLIRECPQFYRFSFDSGRKRRRWRRFRGDEDADNLIGNPGFNAFRNNSYRLKRNRRRMIKLLSWQW